MISQELQEMVVAELKPSVDVRISAIWIRPTGKDNGLDALGRYLPSLAALPGNHEVIVVWNWGRSARDEEITALRGMLEAHKLSGCLLDVHRPCDELSAVEVGIDASQGELIMLLPSYAQVDPDALPDLMAEIDSGADCVTSWRSPRTDSRWNAWKSRLFNFLVRRLTGVPVHDLNSRLGVITREVAQQIQLHGDLHRFLPILASMHGFRLAEVKVRHLQECVQKDDYTPGVYLRRALDLVAVFFLYRFTRKPLRFFGAIGTLTGGMGVLLSLIVAVQRLIGGQSADRPLLVLGVVLIVFGFQLLSLGLLGELFVFAYGKHMRHQHVEKVFSLHDAC